MERPHALGGEEENGSHTMRANTVARPLEPMDEEARQEEIAAMVGTLSAVDLQLQRVEETALKRANVFLAEADQAETSTSAQFNTIGHLLQEICSDVHEIREHIDRLEEFLREGRCDELGEKETAEEAKEASDLEGIRRLRRSSEPGR